MKIGDIRKWLDTVPREFDSFDLVNRVIKPHEGDYVEAIDTPIAATIIDGEHKVACFLGRKTAIDIGKQRK